MRVSIDVTALHDERTGVGVVTAELLERLARRPDLELVAYSVSWRGRGHLTALVPDGVEVASRPMAARPLRRLWQHADLPPIEWWTGPVDAVFGPNFVVPPARRAARIALVHDLTAWRFPELCTADTRRYPGLVGRAVAGGAHVVTPSRFVADEVVAEVGADPDRVHPVHWAPTAVGGGDPAAGRTLAGAERYLLCVGTIEPRKDHALLVRAFDVVADHDPDVRLVVAGPDGWGVEAFDAAVATAGHRHRIVRVGYVGEADRADLLAGAAAFVFPSVYEGFGLPPLEAMAAGVPVVAIAAGAVPEVLGDAALLVAPGDDGGLAAGINEVLDQPGLASSLVERGRRRAASFSWDAAADGVVAAVAAAVDEHRTITAS